MLQGKLIGRCLIAIFLGCCCLGAQAQSRTVPELTTALLAAQTPAEQDSLLAANKTLVKQELFDAVYQAGLSFAGKQDWPQSLNAYRLSIKIARLIGNKIAEGNSLAEIGNNFFDQADYDRSLDYFQKSFTLRNEIGDQNGIASALLHIARIHRKRDDYTLALDYLDQARVLVGAVKDRNIIAGIELETGSVYSTRGDYTTAVLCFKTALTIFQETKSHSDVGLTLNALATAYSFLGDFDQARDYTRQALTEAGENKTVVVRALLTVGVTYGQQGNYGKAIEYFERALQASREAGFHNLEASALIDIGLAQNEQRNYAPALDYYQRALDLVDKQGVKSQISVLLNSIGVLYADQGDQVKALDYYRRALVIARGIKNELLIAQTLISLGDLYYHEGDFDKSIAATRESMELFKKLDIKQWVIVMNDNLALAYLAQNKNEAALIAVNESLALEKAMATSETSWTTFNNLGLVHRALKQNEAAEKAFVESANAVERLRDETGSDEQQQNYLAGRIGPYQNLVELLVEQHRTAEALSYAEKMKARLLLDLLQSGRVQITNAMTPAEKEQERVFNFEAVSLNSQIANENDQDKPDEKRLASLKSQLQRARLNQQEFQTRLYAAHPDLKTQRARMEPFTLARAAALLPDQQTALLEYLIAKDKVFVFVIARDAQGNANVSVYTPAVTSKDLETLTKKYREQLATRDALFKETAAQLYSLLIKPAQAALRGKTKLVIAPDGVLWELPFQALLTEKKTYLIEDYAISFTPSLSVVIEMAKKQQARPASAVGPPTLLAFGNPALGKDRAAAEVFRPGAGFAQLPEAENEVHQLQTLYGKRRSAVFTGRAARETDFKTKAGGFRVIHLATHGILNDASPMYSQIVLAQEANGKDEDGLLEAWEILPLNLHADLAVLSACETARGRVSEGEGMIGLSRALFVAGVPTTVVSQWKVDSASTSALMLEFHRQLLAHHSKAESLREATLKVMHNKQYTHPFYWAAFVVVGDGN